MQILTFLLVNNLNMNLMDFRDGGNKVQLNVGDSVGQINKTSAGEWKLYEDKINKVTVTKKHGGEDILQKVYFIR